MGPQRSNLNSRFASCQCSRNSPRSQLGTSVVRARSTVAAWTRPIRAPEKSRCVLRPTRRRKRCSCVCAEPHLLRLSHDRCSWAHSPQRQTRTRWTMYEDDGPSSRSAQPDALTVLLRGAQHRPSLVVHGSSTKRRLALFASSQSSRAWLVRLRRGLRADALLCCQLDMRPSLLPKRRSAVWVRRRRGRIPLR